MTETGSKPFQRTIMSKRGRTREPKLALLLRILLLSTAASLVLARNNKDHRLRRRNKRETSSPLVIENEDESPSFLTELYRFLLDDMSVPSQPRLRSVGNNGEPEEAFPLGLCQGDCDGDGDCQSGLRCFDDAVSSTVPGCLGERAVNNQGNKEDYCYDPGGQPVPMPTSAPAVPTPISTESPTFSPTMLSSGELQYLTTPELKWSRSFANMGPGNAVTSSLDGKFVYATSESGQLAIFDIEGNPTTFSPFTPLVNVQAEISSTSGVAFGTDASGNDFVVYAITVSQSFCRIVAVTPEGEQLWVSEQVSGACIGDAKVSSDGTYIFINSNNGLSGQFNIFEYDQSGVRFQATAPGTPRPFGPLGMYRKPSSGSYTGGEGNTNDILVWSNSRASGETTVCCGGTWAFQFPTDGSPLSIKRLLPNPDGGAVAPSWYSDAAPVLYNGGTSMVFSVSRSQFRTWRNPDPFDLRATNRTASFETRDPPITGTMATVALSNDPTQPQMFGPVAGNQLVSLNADLSLRWVISTTAPVSSTPQVAPDDSRIFFSDQNGIMYSVLADGSPFWTLGSASQAGIDLSVDGSTLFYGDVLGEVAAWRVAVLSPTGSSMPTSSPPVSSPTLAPVSTPTLSPSTSPTSSDCLLQQLSEVTPIEQLIDSSTPQGQAFDWIKNTDTLDVEDPCNYPMIKQRYGLVTFYYATNGENWTSSTNWLSDAGECSWFGVKCERDALRQLELGLNNLNGTLPNELSTLNKAQGISLFGNSLQSSFPSGIRELSELRLLDVEDNNMSGALFTGNVMELTSLEQFRASFNRFSGIIPTQIGRLSNLQQLWLPENFLQGPLPSELGQLTAIESFFFYTNMFQGPIPSEIGSLGSSLRDFRAYQNMLEGPLPSELGLLTNMAVLLLFQNEIFGEIPEEMYNATGLQALYLHRNNITGSLSGNVRQLTDLVDFRVDSNELSNGLPAELLQLSALQFLHLDNNNFSGEIVNDFASLPELLLFDVSNNNLEGSIPSSIFDLANITLAYFSNNSFVGGIPGNYANPPFLRDLYLDGNQLTGMVPAIATNELTALTEFLVHRNDLVGPCQLAFAH
jgi:Leucine-rich repeat (LRR) protein